MPRHHLVSAIVLALLSAPDPARAEEPAKDAPKKHVVVVTAARVHMGTGETFAPGALRIEDGVLKEAGTTVEIPEGAERWDEPDGVVTPWLVDPVVGVELARGEGGRPESALLSAADARPVQDPWLDALRSRGLGAFALVPEGGGGVQGRTAACSTRSKEASGAELMKEGVALAYTLPEDTTGSAARAAARAALPQLLEDAETWRRQKQQADDKVKKHEDRAPVGRDRIGGPKPAGERRQDQPPNTVQEMLLTVVDKKLPLLVSLSREADALAVLALAEQRSLPVVIAGCRDCGAIAAELARSQAVVVLDPLHDPAARVAGIDPDPQVASRLAKEGARIAVTGGGGWPEGPQVLRAAAAALAGAGVPEPEAVAAMTGNAADAAGIKDSIVLATGKPARFLVWSGSPLDPRSRIRRAAEPEDLGAPKEPPSDKKDAEKASPKKRKKTGEAKP